MREAELREEVENLRRQFHEGRGNRRNENGVGRANASTTTDVPQLVAKGIAQGFAKLLPVVAKMNRPRQTKRAASRKRSVSRKADVAPAAPPLNSNMWRSALELSLYQI